jgi:hypothetical protein
MYTTVTINDLTLYTLTEATRYLDPFPCNVFLLANHFSSFDLDEPLGEISIFSLVFVIMKKLFVE